MNNASAVLREAGGFTLIELIMVMIMIGALVALSAVFIVSPFRSAEDLSRRAELVDIAQTALNRISRETRLALPNSVRVASTGSRRAVEFLRTRTGARYRRATTAGGAGDVLDTTADADSFDVLGTLQDFAGIDADAAGGKSKCIDGDADCLVIYNTEAVANTGFNAYFQTNIATISAASATSLSFANNDLLQAFPAHSPNQRFFVVDMPVSFVCDLTAERIFRYAGYDILSGQPIAAGDFSGANLSTALLADRIDACTFTYDPGAGTRHGLLTVRIDVSKEGETVWLVQQIHVPNVP